ncbi:hypothetical protein [Falsiroseomonas tokyonensis]|uniref:Uncharacterized protein n=1 Tax=Falsiroseomonas tokyonensis TaxID=430521 RepID=A0ABV7C4K1_9PROT|nr:hypothetical protein [Falsiroseomonas tokyonensis]MBU8541794.1 hypothetical protein [Falsiroseomonas tokyonensis]OYW68295.1 MAG: hypothetical protein B7Z40_03310 [Bosea sp. 12-68-7]OYX02275.1 MAG: hypothetical protein B7Z14_03820 [Bosea sp. 32-68-6]
MGDTLGESDLREGLARGGRIEAVLVVARRDQNGGVDHVPYLLPSWRRGYIAMELFRGPGVRGWRDLDRLLRFLRNDMAYALPVSLYEEDCPRLARLRSVLPRSAITKHVKAHEDPLPPGMDVPEPPLG